MNSTTLEEITRTIIDKIHNALGAAVEVTPVLLRNDQAGVGFYLFHVQENSTYRNYPAPGKDTPPVNYTPMALNLFYQLSANSEEHEKQNIYDEQRWMGIAMKALHDNAIINKTIPVLPEFPGGKDINIKITLQTLSPSESVQYWAAAQSPVRLSAYYEVSVVFLEPEKPTTYAGRVLSYGNFIFTRNAPQITSSENIIEYLLPGEVTAMQVKIQPAQAPPAFSAPAPISSVISFIGTGFNGGSLQLLIISPLWPEAAVADASWLPILISENQLNITVQPTALLKTALTPVDVIPGLYAAQISITQQRTLPNGSTKTFNHVSNQFPFSVMPRISLITALGGGLFAVTCNVFQHPGIGMDDIQVHLGEFELDFSSEAIPETSEYIITGATGIQLQIPAGLPAGQVAIRIIIRGIESEPRWITIS